MCLLVVQSGRLRDPPTVKWLWALGSGLLERPKAQRPKPKADYPITSIPIDRAVPRTVLTAAARSVQLRSGIFCFAMSSTCLAVTVPTLLRFGSAEPFARLATFFSSTDAGGVLVMKL